MKYFNKLKFDLPIPDLILYRYFTDSIHFQYILFNVLQKYMYYRETIIILRDCIITVLVFIINMYLWSKVTETKI